MPVYIARKVTCAEFLINISKMLLQGQGRLFVCRGNDTHKEFNSVALAVRFSKMPLAFKFRAIVEEWNKSKIISEMSACGVHS